MDVFKVVYVWHVCFSFPNVLFLCALTEIALTWDWQPNLNSLSISIQRIPNFPSFFSKTNCRSITDKLFFWYQVI